MSHTPGLRAVRAYFGLPQRELATWLGLSLSQLARIETGHDPLPVHAQPWLWPWLGALAQGPIPAPAGPAPVAADPPAGPPLVCARLLECRYQAQRAHHQLAALQTQAGYLHRRLAAGPGLLAALPPAGPTAPAEPAHSPAALRRRWLARLLEAAADGLAADHIASPAAVALLAARHAAWLHEAAWLETYLAPGPANG